MTVKTYTPIAMPQPLIEPMDLWLALQEARHILSDTAPTYAERMQHRVALEALRYPRAEEAEAALRFCTIAAESLARIMRTSTGANGEHRRQ